MFRGLDPLSYTDPVHYSMAAGIGSRLSRSCLVCCVTACASDAAVQAVHCEANEAEDVAAGVVHSIVAADKHNKVRFCRVKRGILRPGYGFIRCKGWGTRSSIRTAFRIVLI